MAIIENDLARIGLLLRSIELDRLALGLLLPTLETIRLNREAGFEHTAQTFGSIRKARIAKRPSLVETERIILDRIASAEDELKRLGVHM